MGQGTPLTALGFEIVGSGTVQLPALNIAIGESFKSVNAVVNHNLGYMPVLLAYRQLTSNLYVPFGQDTNVVPYQNGSLSAFLLSYYYSYITSTALTFFHAITAVGALTGGVGYNTEGVRYYLLRETAAI